MAKYLTAEEKRKKILEIFYESKDFFTLKELEKIAPKKKGINSKLVKELLDSLASDDLIKAEKLGLSIYYWSFPSQREVTRKNAIKKLTEENQAIQTNIDNLNGRLAKEENIREGADRNQLIEAFVEFNRQKEELEKELLKFQRCDPLVFKEKSEKVKLVVNEVNQFVDHIFELQSYCSKKFNLDSKSFLDSFNLPEDLDYLE